MGTQQLYDNFGVHGLQHIGSCDVFTLPVITITHFQQFLIDSIEMV